MAITKAERAAFIDYIKEFKQEIDDTYKKIKQLETKKKKMDKIAGYLSLEIVMDFLSVISLYLQMNDASLEMLHIRNEKFLDNSRKDIYKVIQIMEELVGNEIDRPLKENEEYLDKISKVTPLQMLKIIQKLTATFESVVSKMGESSKWKWSFVDLQGRIAILIKNSINFSDLQKFRDPRSDFYRERQELMVFCKLTLSDAAKQFRNKYELSTRVPSDILKSINMLSALRKIHVLFGEAEEGAKLKNTIDALKARLESDEKKKDSQDKTDSQDSKKKKK